ncbi:hypothetical protein [Allopontixanthobacter sp.]|uniref:hypothetical protein n=1 Tax=Allopontixanthobacter sp. TaxID=2906452 RepID=UPI002ABA2334|nr:hypothetical protein [Allopontixanthobacter sp.]MDZ4308578.1 hypothetical protein [Allopontixanthobacter sp.]
MLHKFLEPGYWFAPKKLGYGAGLPIAWQGWALLLSYMALVIGIGVFMSSLGDSGIAAGVALIFLVTIPFLMIVKRRTEGGWKWRP